ncbi:hypothetical protein GGTG_08179 [Gaeumannomyces tritici R3-111a-1]|uniref:Zinc transporter SLC39A9 n=1 Tax=Gaeumannomyces tritici (strain R3-111a-1) TaxID=644352 RepID=J3P3U4_GAET3|nr:hypothetical protein GGTG_08179 [Gaeumannomyces tritici R3-111a-1]EJT74338.1 hypothetical protein GGTG_08179 [Gaeumannomyces tritici R3-111a-1]
MGGILLLLALCVVMAVASFVAGALPLSLSLSQSQLRLISSIGVGILVGTSLIVIIPEGIEAIATTGTHAGSTSHSHGPRNTPPDVWTLGRRGIAGVVEQSGRMPGEQRDAVPFIRIGGAAKLHARGDDDYQRLTRRPVEQNAAVAMAGKARRRDDPQTTSSEGGPGPKQETKDRDAPSFPTFYIGFSLALGFVLMFLIDRLPRQAMDQFQTAPTTRHISLDNLASSSAGPEEESEGFLGSLAPTPRQSRSLATTTGLVIHAAADGIAMGASATTSNMKLGLIIFVAIMIHKAPAAFGLTSVLLKQGLSKRAARGHLIVFSLAAPVGALATYLFASMLGGQSLDGETGQWWTGMLLLFSGGTFLYVAMHAMQEETNSAHEHHGAMNGYGENGGLSAKRQSRPQMRDTVATVVGMLLPLITQLGHHH